MARRFGAAAFGVTTGVTSAAEWRRQPTTRRPHRVLTDLRQLLALGSHYIRDERLYISH